MTSETTVNRTASSRNPTRRLAARNTQTQMVNWFRPIVTAKPRDPCRRDFNWLRALDSLKEAVDLGLAHVWDKELISVPPVRDRATGHKQLDGDSLVIRPSAEVIDEFLVVDGWF